MSPFRRALPFVFAGACASEGTPVAVDVLDIVEIADASSDLDAIDLDATDDDAIDADSLDTAFVPDTPFPRGEDVQELPPDINATLPLLADGGPDRYAVVGDEVLLDGSASDGAAEYQWFFGSGLGSSEWSASPKAKVTYSAPGRYQAVLSVRDAGGSVRTDGVVVTVTWPLTFKSMQSSTIASLQQERVAVVVTDGDEVVGIDGAVGAGTVLWRAPVPGHPRTVTPHEGQLYVPCDESDQLARLPYDPEIGVVNGPAVFTPLPRASKAYGVVAVGDDLYVSLRSRGVLARIAKDAPDVVAELIPAIEDARDLAVLPDGRIAVSRWRSDPAIGGTVALVDPTTPGDVELVTLAIDTQSPSDTEIGGLPSLLGAVAVSPTAREAVVASMQSGVYEGAFFTGKPLEFDTTMRAVLASLDLAATGEVTEAEGSRAQFDGRGLANAAVFSPHGDFVYVAMRGSRAITRRDALSGSDSGSAQDVGLAIDGLTVDLSWGLVFVDASLSREVVVLDWSGPLPAERHRVATVLNEPLAAEIFRGKQLFNDGYDPRLSRDTYIACAHCHPDGESDHLVWDFTDRGEGLRNTTTLLGNANDGPIHWTGNFDELQDFEHDLRGPFGGTGLIPDDVFLSGGHDQTLGTPKAGLSDDLDALAAYVASLTTELRSPHRQPDGAMTPEALAGKALFDSELTGCTTCHSGPRLTDSAFLPQQPGSPKMPLLHDVGTLKPSSGQRLGGPLPGIDTPTLLGVWATAPYLHDGSAPTLDAVLTTANPSVQHGKTSHLAAPEIGALVAYLQQLEAAP